MAGKVVISAANKAIYLARIKPVTMQGGTLPDSEQKSMEIAAVLKLLLNSITATG